MYSIVDCLPCMLRALGQPAAMKIKKAKDKNRNRSSQLDIVAQPLIPALERQADLSSKLASLQSKFQDSKSYIVQI